MIFSFLFKKKNPHDQKLTKQLEKILGFKPKHLLYYKIALRLSVTNVKFKEIRCKNERLEFLGDSVITLIVSSYLYQKFNDAPEGVLSVLRATIVSRKSLNRIAAEIGLKSIITQKETKFLEDKNITGNSLEALVGAIYFDRGFAACEKFVISLIEKFFDVNNLIKQNDDFKSKLLQISQKEKFSLSIDTFENMEANEKIYHFETEICIEDRFIASSKGWTKKEAEQKACFNVLKILGREI